MLMPSSPVKDTNGGGSPGSATGSRQRHDASFMTIRKILIRGLLVMGILVAAVVLFFAGDHDDPDQDGAKPTVGAHHPND
jgi:hypothetical protein